MTTLFINGSPNKNGNTVALAKKIIRDQSFETLHLADYKIYDYGQDFSDDQFEEVLAKLFEADTIVIGSQSIGIASMVWYEFPGSTV